MSSSAPVPDWLRLQRKIFTRWVNQKVFLSRNIAVNDVVTDIGDGHLLVALMEVLSEKPYTQKLEKNCKLRVQKIDNLSRALKFTWDSGVQMKVKPSPEDLADGDEKRILGLVWAIMLRFMKFGDDDEEQLNAKDALLMWVQNKTTGYRGVKVDNFQKSFHDGLALCAIIHKHRPRLVDYDSLEAGNGLANLRLAMDAAEKYFNLEQYLTPEDVLKLDENSMVVYVSEYYYGIAEQRKLDLAARRIGKVIKLTEENDAMKKEYGVLAQKLKDHLKKVEAVLGDRTIDNTMAGARRKIEEFYDYKENDKGVIIADQLNLEALFNNLAMRLSHNHRPEFVPPAGLALRDIVSAIHELEACEQERKVALIAELNRQIKLVELDEQHKAKHRKLKQWTGEKNAYLNTKEVSESVGAAQYQLKRIEAYGKEREAVYGSTFADLKQRGQYLQSETYERTNEVLAREQELEGDFGELTRLAQAKQPVLEDDLAREQFKEKVRQMNQQHVDKYDNLKTWIAAKQAYLQRVESINSVSEAQVHLSLLDAYRNDNQTSRDTVVAQLGQLGANIKAQKYHTQYSSWVFETPGEIDQREQDIDQQFAHLADLAAQKQKTLEASLALELRKEELRLEFSYLAGEFVRWTKDSVDNVGDKHFGFTLEEVEAYQQTLDASDAAIQADAASKTAAYTAVDQTIVELKVNENPYTNLTLASLAGFKAELDQALGARRDAYQAELAKQRANDALCKKFAGVADPFSNWITETKDKITVSKAELEDQLAFVEARISQLASEGAPRDEINALQQQINDAGITNNRHTTLTAKDVEVQWQQYQTFLQRKKTMLEEEIERKRLRGLTPDQFREIEENFQQFDKRKAGALDARELKACLYSLGEERSRADIANVLQQYGGGSSVSYEQFREFMIHMLGDADTQEEIIEGFKLISRDHEIARVEKLELVMNEHDVNYVRQTAPAKGDGYDYHAWTQDVFSR